MDISIYLISNMIIIVCIDLKINVDVDSSHLTIEECEGVGNRCLRLY